MAFIVCLLYRIDHIQIQSFFDRNAICFTFQRYVDPGVIVLRCKLIFYSRCSFLHRHVTDINSIYTGIWKKLFLTNNSAKYQITHTQCNNNTYCCSNTSFCFFHDVSPFTTHASIRILLKDTDTYYY